MSKKFIFSITFLLLFSNYTFSQNKIIDSLKLVVKTTKKDSLKIKAYCDLCYYYGNISIDSAFYFGKKALQIAEATNNLNGKAQSLNDMGILYYRTAKYDSATTFYHKALKIRVKNKDTLGTASLYNKLGISFQQTFKMDSAIYYSTKALKIYEQKKLNRYVLVIKNNIANVYQDLKQYNKALNTHLELAKLSSEINDIQGLTRAYTNIGNSYLLLNDTTRSLEYYKKGINIAEKNNLTRPLSALYNNYGALLKNQKNYTKAINYYIKSLDIRNKFNDNYGIASSALSLADIYLLSNQIEKAKSKLKLGLNIAKEIKATELEMNAYNNLLSYHAYLKNTDSIIYYKNLHQVYQDSIFSSRITKEVAEIQEKYDAVEREKEIALQKEQILESEIKIKNRNFYTVLLSSSLLLLCVASFATYKYQNNKRKQLRKQLELKDTLAKVQTQNKLQEQRLRISRDLHDNIGSQLTFIISSINNLKFTSKIEDNTLKTKLTNINDFASNTISQLRDTIWAMKKNEIYFDDFYIRLLSFIEKAKSAKPDIQFHITNEISSALIFSSVKGVNIYRILQETINNAIKHAEALDIKIELKEINDQLILTVYDNGKGFELDKTALGNGLENMQKRAEEINANFKLYSSLNKGTEITITIAKNTINAV